MAFKMVEQAVSEIPHVIIKVIGVGGGGGNAINRMIEKALSGVEFISANTDTQALHLSKGTINIQLGKTRTKGHGAGRDPKAGEEAAEESYQELVAALQGADMVFIATGLGGGTGTGASPVVARACKEIGALTVAVVTKPFQFEGKQRKLLAEEGWKRLREQVDTIITIPNDRLLPLVTKECSKVEQMFSMVDDVLYHAVKGITDLIKLPGMMNVDFADLKAVMQHNGPAVMGTGEASGENRATEAAKKAIDNQLLEDVGIDGAKGLLVNISGVPGGVSMLEYSEATSFIQSKVDEDAIIIPGVLFDESLPEDVLRVTVVATGIARREEMNELLKPQAGRRRSQANEPKIPSIPFNGAPFIKEHLGSSKDGGSLAKPNAAPRGLALMTPIVFDEALDDDELDTPAYLRKTTN